MTFRTMTTWTHTQAIAGLAAAVIFGAAFTPSALANAKDAPQMTARQVAGQVQAFYERTRSVKAVFRQTYYHRLYDRYDRSSGQVVFKKPGRMRWDYDRPNGKVIVSDGNQLRVFEPGEPGEPGQVFENDLGEHQLPQAFSFLTGAGDLAATFRFRLVDASKHSFRAGHILELLPREPSPHYDRILFYVDAHPDRAGVVHRVLIVDPAGNRNRFDFRDLRFNEAVADSVFRFRPPAGTRRIRP